MNYRETAAMAGLSGVIGAIALASVWLGRATWLEAISFVTGALCVWLTVRQSIWNFPTGLINVITFGIVFFQARLFADAGLQVVYFALLLSGWYLWLRGGERHTELKVSRARPAELAGLTALAASLTLALWMTLERWGGSASFWDALTTSISLASQWMLNRKRLESWVGWIIVDAIYIPLYASKELYLTAILYAIFLAMAIAGLRAWRESWLLESATISPGSPTRAEAS